MDLTEAKAQQLEAAGWTVDREELAALERDIEMTDPAMLDALLNPLRVRMLAALARRPGSVKELAERFEVPTTRLYHHLGLLEEYGAVQVVATRRSGARTERCYAAVRGGVGLSPELLEGHVDEVAETVVKIVGLAGETAAAALRAGRVKLDDPGARDGFVSFLTPRLTAEQRTEIFEEFEALQRRMAELSEVNELAGATDGEPTMVLVVGVPDVLSAGI